MSLCASCSLQLAANTSLCPHHHAAPADGWAVGNRILCDFVHRGIVPRSAPPEARREADLEMDPMAARRGAWRFGDVVVSHRTSPCRVN
jgi:hypothetical protein